MPNQHQRREERKARRKARLALRHPDTAAARKALQRRGLVITPAKMPEAEARAELKATQRELAEAERTDKAFKLLEVLVEATSPEQCRLRREQATA